MKNIKRILGVLLSCLMLMSMLSVGVFAASGDQDDPINANDTWFGYGVDCYLLNPTLTAGDEDGVWYTFTADTAGILQLEHSYKNVDYDVTLWVNGVEYKAYDGDIYTRPITTYPVAKGDVATINVKAKDTSVGGGVYANIKIVTGENDPDQTVKMKSEGAKVYVAAGSTVYYQDDSTAAVYATKGLIVSGDSVADITVYSVLTTGNTAYTDIDGDGTIELKLAGSLGGAGAPAVKPSWAIQNDSAVDRCFVLNVVASAHECVYTDDTDVDCGTCGAIRELPTACEHEYTYACDKVCKLCGEETRPEPPHYPNNYPCNHYCTVCLTPLGNTADHVDEDGDTRCDVCYSELGCDYGYHTYDGNCDADCNKCGEPRVAPHSSSGKPCYNYCIVCLTPLGNTADHVDEDGDTFCDVCRIPLGCDYGYHTYGGNCDADCNECGETRVAPHYPSGYPCNNYCAVCLTDLENTATHVNEDGDTRCDVCYELLGCEDGYHTYDNDYDADCNVCGAIREVELPISFRGNSVSEDVSGLAFLFEVAVDGMTVNGTTAIYDNATVNGCKLISMGAAVSNGMSDVDVKAVYLYGLKSNSAQYAVRIIHIPEEGYNTAITAVPYIVIEIDGEETTIYGESISSTYNGVLNG